MTPWLDPLLGTLDASTHPIVFFFRDDDVGWGDERLWALLDRFGEHRHAGGPGGDPGVADGAADRLSSAAGGSGRTAGSRSTSTAGPTSTTRPTVGAASSGRPAARRTCGPTCGADGRRWSPPSGRRSCEVFVPPWNRCTDATARVLRDEGVRALSRDVTAEPFGARRSRRGPGHRRLVRQAQGRRPRRRPRNGDSCWRRRRLGRCPSA